jgi:hypothetical protein
MRVNPYQCATRTIWRRAGSALAVDADAQEGHERRFSAFMNLLSKFSQEYSVRRGIGDDV